ncbi:CdaR family transcriptional regulator [Lactonifactor longoviformis]|uniref:PucR C-terminal helix-turn-helix domain-containing protein n=3 Tax=Lactonifactor TaxID=420345 RepID=A0A1M4VM78_9CLOT|nr:helix-turn-helix domain-containing protein [Lactonifactor longoviformis]SHE69955.1 PucR C-terminal helix-turn-helix domain-containing protein [Lactonifactor longoviformis DSM 17459]
MADSIDFLELYEKIFKVLPRNNVQRLMEVCYEVVGVPILTVDVMYNLLGIAPNVKTGDYQWDYLLENKGYETDMIVRLYEDGIMQSVNNRNAPYVVDWGSCRDNPKIQGIVKVNDIVEGYVTMQCTYDQITPDRLKAMDIIMNVCALFFRENDSESSMPYTYQKVFAGELFNHRIKTPRQLTMWQKDMNCDLNPPYQIFAVSTYDKSEKNVLSYIRKLSQQFSPYQFALIQENILYVLHYNMKKRPRGNSEETLFIKTLRRFNGCCGASRYFDDLLCASDYIKQAEDAMTLGQSMGSPNGVHYYESLYLPAILAPRLSQMPRTNYISPAIPLLEEYDSENSTEFLKTLEAYTKNLFRTSETAAQLHIHRNTLLYRVQKIEEIGDFSLKDYSTVLHLMISFYMLDLENNYNT